MLANGMESCATRIVQYGCAAGLAGVVVTPKESLIDAFRGGYELGMDVHMKGARERLRAD